MSAVGVAATSCVGNRLTAFFSGGEVIRVLERSWGLGFLAGAAGLDGALGAGFDAFFAATLELLLGTVALLAGVGLVVLGTGFLGGAFFAAVFVLAALFLVAGFFVAVFLAATFFLVGDFLAMADWDCACCSQSARLPPHRLHV